jgi:O-antigen ligase
VKKRVADLPRRIASRAGILRATPVKERVAALLRLPPGERRFFCLFWSFWLTLATFPAGYAVRDIMPAVCFVFLILHLRRNRHDSVLFRLDARPLFYCLWLMMLIGVLFSVNVGSSLLHVGRSLNMGIILPFIAMECVREEKDLRRLVWACVTACFWQGLDGVWQAGTGRDFLLGYARNGGRLTGSLGDYSVGNYIALAMIPAFGLWSVLRRALPPVSAAFLWAGALWPAFFLLVGAASRSGALAVTAAFAFRALLSDGKTRLKCALLFPAALPILLWLQGRNQVEAVLDDGRWSLWKLGWNVFLEHPWFGAGAGQYNTAFRELGLAPEKDLITISHPHNIFLDMLYAHGLAGFTLGMIFLLGFLMWGCKRIRPRLAAEAACNGESIYWRLTVWFWIGFAAWLVNGIFGHDFYRTWWTGLAMSYLGVMIGAVVNGCGTPEQGTRA